METKQRKQYTAEFKAQTVALMATGKPVAQLAQELCVSSNLLYNWRHHWQVAQGDSAGAQAVGEGSDADALRRLRRENALLKEENLILKKAAVILGTRIPPNFAR